MVKPIHISMSLETRRELKIICENKRQKMAQVVRELIMDYYNSNYK